MKPLLKYPGSKFRLTNYLLEMAPQRLTFDKYAEPFVGGGSFFCVMAKQPTVKELFISDIDANLIDFYWTVQQECKELLREIFNLLEESDGTKEAYMKLRSDFNFDKEVSRCKQSARYYLLNRTTFNGLMRYNSSGDFNTPYGKLKNWRNIVIPECNFLEWHEALQRTTVRLGEYTTCLDFCDHRTLVFLDPPYFLRSPKNKFSYGGEGHTAQFHKELNDFYVKLNGEGCLLMQTNSNEEFIANLYWRFYSDVFSSPYIINHKVNERANVEQLLIYNY